MNTIQAEMVSVLAEIPPPKLEIFKVASFYIGPGPINKSWRIHPGEFATQAKAEEVASKLESWHQHRTIFKIQI